MWRTAGQHASDLQETDGVGTALRPGKPREARVLGEQRAQRRQHLGRRALHSFEHAIVDRYRLGKGFGKIAGRYVRGEGRQRVLGLAGQPDHGKLAQIAQLAEDLPGKGEHVRTREQAGQLLCVKAHHGGLAAGRDDLAHHVIRLRLRRAVGQMPLLCLGAFAVKVDERAVVRGTKGDEYLAEGSVGHCRSPTFVRWARCCPLATRPGSCGRREYVVEVAALRLRSGQAGSRSYDSPDRF